jgi:DNA-binding Lrp family transcriptional regulator
MLSSEVDEVDRRLIRCLLDSPRASYAELARATGVGETTARPVPIGSPRHLNPPIPDLR